MRQLKTAPLQHYGVFIAMDNALPHLEREEEVLFALKAMKDRLKKGGHLLLSLRDYDKLMKDRSSFTPPSFFQDGKYIVLPTESYKQYVYLRFSKIGFA